MGSRRPENPIGWLFCAIGLFAAIFSPGPIDAIGGAVENPLGMELLRGVGTNSAVGPVESLLYVLGILAAASLFARMRRATGVQRQQLKWFAYATVVLVGGSVLAFTVSEATSVHRLGEIGFVLTMVGLAGMPMPIGIAVLRYHLYNIDRIIDRTLVYGLLTAKPAALYLGAVVALQRLFIVQTSEKSTLAVVASTLLIAALFTPLRRHILAFIDRRFYRRRYDTRKTMEAFSVQLRNETDLEALSADLEDGKGDDAASPHLLVDAPQYDFKGRATTLVLPLASTAHTPPTSFVQGRDHGVLTDAVGAERITCAGLPGDLSSDRLHKPRTRSGGGE